ncbi:peptide ABC transporter ATP-binding protein [Rhizobium sp. Root708]|uniref:ABC transporter ATP-binding protein n=1 Tax=Rhizobium sp. Root708 TaxID=1736592 RepID=UPI0006F5BACB|nr:ABC transporter ATP-binding protein [Rhizobium sp. Root708]KRB59391.1 peptide ABC transporter ATP-binding protein [Rhizobium sp. Root708]
MVEPLLTINDLRISFPSPNGPVSVVNGVSLEVGREVVALVGESGSGKSMTGRAAMGLLPSAASIEAKQFTFEGRDLTRLSGTQWNALRGLGISLVLQDPKYSLNPAHKVGRQVEETLLLHTRLSAKERRQRALEMLSKVGLADPERVYQSYPAALSGGMGQRVMIAAMLINNPRLLIADEPTSALDRGLQDQILALLRSLTADLGMGLLLISHDLQQVHRYADRVLVMRQGALVEELASANLANASSPYTRALWAARPSAATYGTRLPVFEGE